MCPLFSSKQYPITFKKHLGNTHESLKPFPAATGISFSG